MKKNKQKRVLTILRGLSGSGKSTVAEVDYRHSTICSADHYFFDAAGKYNFNFSMLGKAHAECKEKCKKAMILGEESIVIDNTNSTIREMTPYLTLAKQYKYKVEVIRINRDIDTCILVNTKGVPENIIRRMASRFVNYPGEKIIENG
jgi:predicted kinase